MEPLLVNTKGLQEMLRLSASAIHLKRKRRELPFPVRIGRCVRWNVQELKAWVEFGCPNTYQWEAEKARRQLAADGFI